MRGRTKKNDHPGTPHPTSNINMTDKVAVAKNIAEELKSLHDGDSMWYCVAVIPWNEIY
jgi:hypothetical protein